MNAGMYAYGSNLVGPGSVNIVLGGLPVSPKFLFYARALRPVPTRGRVADIILSVFAH